MIDQNLWNCELGRKSMKVPEGNIIGLQQRDRQDSQNLNIGKLYDLPVTSAQGIIGPEEYRHAGILLNYDNDDSIQGYAQI